MGIVEEQNTTDKMEDVIQITGWEIIDGLRKRELDFSLRVEGSFRDTYRDTIMEMLQARMADGFLGKLQPMKADNSLCKTRPTFRSDLEKLEKELSAMC